MSSFSPLNRANSHSPMQTQETERNPRSEPQSSPISGIAQPAIERVEETKKSGRKLLQQQLSHLQSEISLANQCVANSGLDLPPLLKQSISEILMTHKAPDQMLVLLDVLGMALLDSLNTGSIALGIREKNHRKLGSELMGAYLYFKRLQASLDPVAGLPSLEMIDPMVRKEMYYESENGLLGKLTVCFPKADEKGELSQRLKKSFEDSKKKYFEVLHLFGEIIRFCKPKGKSPTPLQEGEKQPLTPAQLLIQFGLADFADPKEFLIAPHIRDNSSENTLDQYETVFNSVFKYVDYQFKLFDGAIQSKQIIGADVTFLSPFYEGIKNDLLELKKSKFSPESINAFKEKLHAAKTQLLKLIKSAEENLRQIRLTFHSLSQTQQVYVFEQLVKNKMGVDLAIQFLNDVDKILERNIFEVKYKDFHNSNFFVNRIKDNLIYFCQFEKPQTVNPLFSPIESHLANMFNPYLEKISELGIVKTFKGYQEGKIKKEAEFFIPTDSLEEFIKKEGEIWKDSFRNFQKDEKKLYEIIEKIWGGLPEKERSFEEIQNFILNITAPVICIHIASSDSSSLFKHDYFIQNENLIKKPLFNLLQLNKLDLRKIPPLLDEPSVSSFSLEEPAPPSLEEVFLDQPNEKRDSLVETDRSLVSQNENPPQSKRASTQKKGKTKSLSSSSLEKQTPHSVKEALQHVTKPRELLTKLEEMGFFGRKGKGDHMVFKLDRAGPIVVVDKNSQMSRGIRRQVINQVQKAVEFKLSKGGDPDNKE